MTTQLLRRSLTLERVRNCSRGSFPTFSTWKRISLSILPFVFTSLGLPALEKNYSFIRTHSAQEGGGKNLDGDGDTLHWCHFSCEQNVCVELNFSGSAGNLRITKFTSNILSNTNSEYYTGRVTTIARMLHYKKFFNRYAS